MSKELDWMLSVSNPKTNTELQIGFSATEEDADNEAVELIYTLFPDTDVSELEYDYWRV